MCLLALFGCRQDLGVSTIQEIIVEDDPSQVIVDSIIQPDELGALDVIVVLDKSCSMSDDDARVGQGIATLASDIATLTEDYKIGFITTDSSCPTVMAGPFDINNSSIDIAMAPSVLPQSCGYEEGFASFYAHAMSDSSFMRDDADLLLFFISDEEEQSAITSQMFYDWVEQFKGDNIVEPVVITTTEDSECGSYGTYGYKYVELATLYGKDYIDLCSSGWEVWLSQTSFLMNLRDNINLSQIPIDDSIKVYLNHIETDLWTYDNASNTVYFEFDIENNQLIEVAYKSYL